MQFIYEAAKDRNVSKGRNGKPLSEIIDVTPEGRADTKAVNGILKKNPPEADYDPDGIRKELYRMFGV